MRNSEHYALDGIAKPSKSSSWVRESQQAVGSHDPASVPMGYLRTP